MTNNREFHFLLLIFKNMKLIMAESKLVQKTLKIIVTLCTVC